MNCNGIANELFNCDKKKIYKNFNKKITEERFNEIKNKMYELFSGWLPRANNFHILKLNVKNNSEIPSDKLIGYDKLDWSEMPKEALEYIKSLPEFNKNMFRKITGLK